MPEPLFICDIDGTVANLEHRLHFIQRDQPDWDGFYDACPADTPIVNVVQTVWMLKNSGATVYFFTGRSERVRQETKEWLEHQFYSVTDEHLVMRPDGDYTPDDELKRDMYERMLDCDKERLVAIFDDRERVVKMWRDIGLQCFQCKPGDY